MRVAVFVLGFFLLSQAAVAQPAIYRCVVASGTVYSDRPCDAAADPHQIDDSRVTVYTPPPLAERTTASAKPPKKQSTKAPRLPDPAKHKVACAKLDQGLRDVRTKMRSGYRVGEGERLKARQRQLDERRRTAKCR